MPAYSSLPLSLPGVPVVALLLLLLLSLLSCSPASRVSASSESSPPPPLCVSWNYSLSQTWSVPAPLNLTAPFDLYPSDDAVTEVPLGFAFPFYGTEWTSVNVSTNGNVQFGTGNIAWVDETVPMSGMSGSIFFYFVDLNPDEAWMQQAQTLTLGGGGSDGTDGGAGGAGGAGNGASPEQASQLVTVIRYTQVPVCPFGEDATHNDTANDTSTLAAQPSVTCDVLLHAQNGSIEVRYYDISPTPYPVDIGVQDSTLTRYTTAVQHAVMTQSLATALTNTTLTFTPYCAQYASTSTTQRVIGNAAAAGAGAGAGAAATHHTAALALLLAAASLAALALTTA